MTGRRLHWAYWFVAVTGVLLVGAGVFFGGHVFTLISRASHTIGMTPAERLSLDITARAMGSSVALVLGVMILLSCLAAYGMRTGRRFALRHIDARVKWANQSAVSQLLAAIKRVNDEMVDELGAIMEQDTQAIRYEMRDITDGVVKAVGATPDLTEVVRALTGNARTAIEAASRHRTSIDEKLTVLATQVTSLACCVESLSKTVTTLAPRPLADEFADYLKRNPGDA